MELHIEELTVAQYKEEHPEHLSFLCHRFVSMEKARAHGLSVPATTMAEGLRQHVASVLEED